MATNNDEMNKYDSAAIGATLAGGTTASILISKMLSEQELFNNSGGTKGVNWSGDAKKLDAKLAALPKNVAVSVKNGLLAAPGKAWNAALGTTTKAKDVIKRSAASTFISDEDILGMRAKIQTLHPDKDADTIVDLKDQIKSAKMQNKVADFISEYNSNDQRLSDLKGNKTAAKEYAKLKKVNKELNTKINNYIDDPEIAAAIESGKVTEKLARDSGRVNMKRKTPLPKKTLALLAAGGAANYFMGDKIRDVADASHGVADLADTFDYDDDSFDITDAVSVAGDTLGTVGDVLSYAPGAASTAAIAGTAGNYGLNRLKDRYNILNDPEGLGKIASLKQAGKDVGGATKDYLSKVGGTASDVTKYLGTGAVFASENTKRKLAAKRAKRAKYLQSRKAKRWTDPRAEELRKRNEEYDKDIDKAESKRAEAAKTASEVEARRNTGTRAHVLSELDIEIQNRRYSVERNNQILDSAAEKPHLAKNNEYINSVRADIRSATDDIIEFEGKKEYLNKLNTDADIKGNAQYSKYIAGIDNTTKIKNQANIIKQQARITTEDMAAKVKGVVDDVVDTGTEKTKGFVESAKQKATDAYKRAVGRSVTPEAGLSQTPDMPGAPKPKSGVVTKAAKLGGKLGGIAALPQVGEAGWGLAQMGLDLYDAPDKQQYIEETGADIYEGIKQMPEDIMRTGADYKTMWEQGEYMPMVGKAMTDYAVPSVKALGNIAMGIGEQTGLIDEAPGYWDMDKAGFYTVDDTEASPYDTFHASEQSDAVKASMIPPKTSGVTSPGVEGEDALNKREQAEIYNKQQATTREAAMQEAIAKKKYGGYTSERDYADAYGVKTAADHFGVTDSGRYGGTPIYVSEDGTSFSDVPTNVMDPSKYDKVASQAANKARQQYVKFEKASKEQAKQKARGGAFAGMTDEQYDSLGLAGQAKANLDYNKSLLSRKKETDLYERNLDVTKGFYGPERGAYIDTLANTMAQGQSTPEQRVQTATEINKGRVKEGWKVPFMDTPDPRSFGTHENVPGVIFESVPDELQSLSRSYDYLTGYKPK